jgi:pyruvate dehydrogenase E1 component
MDTQRWNSLHPEKKARTCYVTSSLLGPDCPVIAATDYMKIYADQIREYVPGRYVVLGTDGFGRSDTRAKLRKFFEVDRFYITVAALKALADDNLIPVSKVAQAIKKYNIDPEKPNPVTV